MINPFFHDIAIKLVGLISNKAKLDEKEKDMTYRTAINRLYYSTFHNIVLYFRLQFTPSEERAIHTAIQEKLIVQDHDAIASILEEMRLLRVDADYRLAIPNTKTRFEKMMSCHDIIIELLASNASG